MKISQREARRLRKRVKELEGILTAYKDKWSDEYPSWTVLHRVRVMPETKAIVNTARALKHAVAVTMQGDDLTLFGCEL